jgi:ribosomal protein L37E
MRRRPNVDCFRTSLQGSAMRGPVEDVGARTLCRRCGKAARLILEIDRLGVQSGYQIFECSECGYVDWIEKR